MAASGQKLLCLDGMQLDVAPQYLKATQARFIKNLYYQLSDLGEAGTSQGAQTGVLKPLPSNEIYCPIDLPSGDNHVIGTLPSRETNELYVFVYNSENNHLIFVIDGIAATCTIVKIDPCFDFKLEPQYFVGEGQSHLEVSYVTDPATDQQLVKKDLYWTLGINNQGFLRVGDSIATNGFDANLFPYFSGTYDKCPLVRMGLPTPNDCIKIEEEPFNPIDAGKNNNINRTSWQFRVLDVNVYGKASEHGIISDLYFLSNNDCLGQSDELSRCVKLTFDAGNPFVDKKQIEYRNCNDEQWYTDTVLDLYNGSNLGEWWTRPRNADIVYDPTSNKITYTFCKDKLCDPIPTEETNRTQNDLPRTSQALTKIGRDISLSNNKDGFSPFGKDIMDNVSVEVIAPTTSPIGDTANITIWIRIYNPYLGFFQKVWKKDKDYVFGGIANQSIRAIPNIKSDYNQNFAVEGQKGYLGYLAGTSNYAIGVQYYLDSSGNFIEDKDFLGDGKNVLDVEYYQKFEFTGIPKGNYIFRLASHLANPNLVDIRTTSTYVGGVWNFSNFTVGTVRTYEQKELEINVCTSDYDTLTSGEMLLTYDMTRPVRFPDGSSLSKVTVLDGYVYEKINPATNENDLPVELLEVSVQIPVTSGHSNENSAITDHNGFYFAGSLSSGFRVKMTGFCNCIKKELIRGGAGNFQRRYIQNMVIGLTSQQGFITSCDTFETMDCSRISITGEIQLCGSGTGIPNITVVLTRGGFGVTDAQGKFTIIAHDDVKNPFRTDDIYVMGGGCAFTACDGGCIVVKNVIINPCVGGCNARTIDVGLYEVLFILSKGLLSNGRYGVSLTGYDWLGRHGFSQTTDKLYFDIPSLNTTQTFGFSTVNVIIPPSIVFPSWIEYLTIGITLELNYAGNFIEWIADKVEFVDNSGNINDAAPTQIKIYYGSLNEYNVKNNFNTTTGWQIIPASETSPRTADIVQFIRNGDGTFFPNPISAIVKYDQAGQYFLINYTDALKDLKENSLIRLANPNECASKDIFLELCGKIDVVDGHAQQNKITLNAFDTYYQYRQIPVPITTGTGDNATIIEVRQFGFPFEHSSITDTYGYRCFNGGRINIRNPYEAELIHLNQIALSGASNITGQLNYLDYFEEIKKVDFNINSTGGIVYVRVKTGLVLVICQYKNFIVGYGDNIARLNSENIITVASGDSTFGNPERTYSGNFGCILFDKNTIREVETSAQAFCQWLDRKEVAILQNDFQQTVDVSRYNKSNSTIVSWLTQKIKYQNDFNAKNNNTRYFHACINPLNFSWLLSEFTIGSEDFVNTEREVNVSKHETISLDILGQVWNEFLSPTPEYFGVLKGADNGQLLFYFKHGIPYSQSNTSFNNFFDVACESVYRFIFSTDAFKKKKFQSIWSYCVDKKYWSDLILTEKQKSRLLKDKWVKHDFFYSAAFLCNVDTPSDPNTPQVTLNKITEGDNLFGSFCEVRLIGDADNQYSELYGVIVFAVGDEQSG